MRHTLLLSKGAAHRKEVSRWPPGDEHRRPAASARGDRVASTCASFITVATRLAFFAPLAHWPPGRNKARPRNETERRRTVAKTREIARVAGAGRHCRARRD